MQLVELGMKDKVTIENKDYFLIKERSYGKGYFIFQNEDTILRIGPKKLVDQDLDRNEYLISKSFPVAEVLGRGTYEGKQYFIERKIKGDHFGKIFAREFDKKGKISDETFEEFINIVEKYFMAQLKTIGDKESDFSEMFDNFVFKLLYEEIPERKPEVDELVLKFKSRLKDLPFVFTHGDFNAFNILPSGVIDFEFSMNCPFGYDAFSFIYHNYFFPVGEGYEFKQSSQFSAVQIERALVLLNELATRSGISNILDYRKDFQMYRIIFSSVGMQSTPKLMKWRYDIFDKALDLYLNDEEFDLPDLNAQVDEYYFF